MELLHFCDSASLFMPPPLGTVFQGRMLKQYAFPALSETGHLVQNQKMVQTLCSLAQLVTKPY